MFYLYVNKYLAQNSRLQIPPPPPIRTAHCSLFLKKIPIIRIYRLSGWLAFQVNPDKWSSTVHIRSILVVNVVGIPASCLHQMWRFLFLFLWSVVVCGT
jgi:hypothetical protein